MFFFGFLLLSISYELEPSKKRATTLKNHPFYAYKQRENDFTEPQLFSNWGNVGKFLFTFTEGKQPNPNNSRRFSYWGGFSESLFIFIFYTCCLENVCRLTDNIMYFMLTVKSMYICIEVIMQHNTWNNVCTMKICR